MNPEAREQELFVLRLLGEAESPVGAGTVREHLASKGFSASEATVGRLLRELDRRGLTSRVGFQGRVLTDLGSRRLAELSTAREQEASAGTLLERIHSGGEDAVTELLAARKAVEGELARLAAERFAGEAEDELLSAIGDWEKRARSPETGDAEAYRAFFRTLARIAGNGILTAMDEILLGREEKDAFSGMEGAVAEDFAALMQALRKNDPDAAEKTARNHIDRFVKRRGKKKD
jgi:GntR family L-lactate dehydrogenase operon transcriptional regulator